MGHIRALTDFQGAWRLSRQINDTRHAVTGALEGTARFVAAGDGVLNYVEEGTLTYADQAPMTATRRYVWTAADAAIHVAFEDGSPFHVIALDRSMPDDNHHCDPDFYHVSYDFTAWPQWRASWRVQGPAKDYRMVSDYAPV